jgi:hypothetical protein
MLARSAISVNATLVSHNNPQIIAKKALPDDIRDDLAAHIGCIAGAIEVDIYKRLLVDAGFAGRWWKSQQDLNHSDTPLRRVICRHPW